MRPTRESPEPAAPSSAALLDAGIAVASARWSSLAVIPARAGVSARPVARAIEEASAEYQLGALSLIDAEGASIAAARDLTRELDAARNDPTRRVLVLVDSPLANLSGIPLVMAAEALLVVVSLEDLDLDALHSTREMVGGDRILGVVTLAT